MYRLDRHQRRRPWLRNGGPDILSECPEPFLKRCSLLVRFPKGRPAATHRLARRHCISPRYPTDKAFPAGLNGIRPINPQHPINGRHADLQRFGDLLAGLALSGRLNDLDRLGLGSWLKLAPYSSQTPILHPWFSPM
jgi:hypothetical protein